MKSESNSILLTGSDYFVYALCHQMRSAGLGGNICRLVLRLDGPIAIESLRTVIQKSESVNRLANVSMRRRFLVGTPCWFSSVPAGEVALDECKADLSGTDWLSIYNNGVRHTLRPQKAPAFAFDLVHYPENKTDFVLSWHHSLMDARGAEAFLLQISNPKAGVLLLENEFAGGEYFLQNTGLSREAGIVKKLAFARRSLVFIEKIHCYPVAALIPRVKDKNKVRHSYKPVHFSEEESQAVEVNCEKLGAGFHKSLFILAAVIRAFHAIRVARGEDTGAYVIPVPQDLRKRGLIGPILSNHVTFLFYRVEPEETADIKTLIASLKKQMVEQIRLKFHYAFSTAMEIFRFLPVSVYAKVLSRPSRNKMATFFFSDTGESLPGIEGFLGVPVADLCHLAPVPVPPGVAVISGRFRSRLRIVLSQADGCLTEQEQELFERTVRDQLLTQGEK